MVLIHQQHGNAVTERFHWLQLKGGLSRVYHRGKASEFGIHY